MATKWTQLGEKLKTARIALGKEQQQIAAEIGIGRVAVGNIEKGRVSKLTPSIRSYAHIVGWTDDSPERVLAGGEPALRSDGPQASVVEGLGAAPDLAIDVREALRRGPLLKSQVVEVETPTGRVLATIVLRGQEGMSSEELLASLRAVTVRVSADETGNQPKE